MINPPMFQDNIGGRRASLYPPQRPRNGFCSTGGRPETAIVDAAVSSLRPKSGKRSDFDADAVRVRIDVRLRQPHPQRAQRRGTPRPGRRSRAPASPAGCSGAPPQSLRPRCAGNHSSTRAPDRRRPAAPRSLEPDLDRDQQPLRRADLELVEADVGLHRERFEQDPRRADLEIGGHEARSAWARPCSCVPQELDVAIERQEPLPANRS